MDLEQIGRSGPHGRATVQDVARAAATANTVAGATARPASGTAASPNPSDGRVENVSLRRRIIAESVLESLRVSAQLTTVVEVDLTRVSRAGEAEENGTYRRQPVPLTALAYVAEAALYALGSHPAINARLDLDAGTVTHPAGTHLGVAIDSQDGLVVPVIRDAGDLSVAGLARQIADVASRVRGGTLTAAELSGGTFTLTDTGSSGALFDTPIINQPQSAILGLGAIVRRPMAVVDASGQEHLAFRSMAYLALTYDHRLVDGAEAARYLSTVKDRLERPDLAGSAIAGSASSATSGVRAASISPMPDPRTVPR